MPDPSSDNAIERSGEPEVPLYGGAHGTDEPLFGARHPQVATPVEEPVAPASGAAIEDTSTQPTQVLPVIDTQAGAEPQAPAPAPGSAAAAWAALAAESDRLEPMEPLPADEPMPAPREHVWWWIAGGSFVALLVIVAVFVGWMRFGRPVAVPDVKGTQSAQATQILNDAGLVLGAVSEQATDGVAPGEVISQKPGAGQKVRPGTQISLVVAGSGDRSLVPSLVGKTQAEAEAQLAKSRLLPMIVASNSATVAVGYIVGQLPESGQTLPPGSSVAVVVSKGPSPVSYPVPSLQGLTEEEATKLFAGTPLDLDIHHGYSATSAGLVVTQTPAPRTTMPAGGVVQVWVSQGPGVTPVTVPSVVGLSEGSANGELVAAGLKVATRVSASATVASGVVISQMPPAAAQTAAGGTVSIVVSSGTRNTAVVPTVNGMQSDVAQAAVRQAGFKPVLVTVPIAGAVAGSVAAQFPLVGIEYPLGLPVVLLVASGA